ncbi:MAG: CAP domain-containing protein [Deltaproteobacteria bacterium]|nr:CAP domain-containing protein [Deltaproteobacteria bacterium]
MKRYSIFICAVLFALHATAGAEKDDNDAPIPPGIAAVAPKPKAVCLKDKKLTVVAKQLAELQHIPPSPELIRTAREAGVDANPVYAKFGVAGEIKSFKSWLRDLDETADAPLICGRARVGERVVLVAAVRAGSLSVNEKQDLHAEVIEDFRDPYLVVRDSKGTSRRIAVEGEGFGATVTLPLEWGRPLFVQLVATGPNGPRPVAERWVGKIPRNEPTRRGSQSPEAWLMQLRRAAGARSLRSNRLLTREATSHAQTVCESGKLGHELDPWGDPEARLLKRGLQARVVGEAVARAQTMREALRVIEDSPSHRMTVTDPRFTDAGYGKAKDEKGRTCAVVLLASWPRMVP